MRARRGLSKDEINELQRTIPVKDPIADKQGKPVHHGNIEAIENATFPWLKARRRNRLR